LHSFYHIGFYLGSKNRARLAYRFYSGCWWIFHGELDDVRDMLNPGTSTSSARTRSGSARSGISINIRL